MDALLTALAAVSEQLVPILGAVALIFLCILLKKCWEMIESLTKTIDGLDPTLRLVDQSIEKLQPPLDTVAKYSHSLDKVHDKTAEAFGKAADFAAENVNGIKDFIGEKIAPIEEKIAPLKDKQATEGDLDE